MEVLNMFVEQSKIEQNGEILGMTEKDQKKFMNSVIKMNKYIKDYKQIQALNNSAKESNGPDIEDDFDCR